MRLGNVALRGLLTLAIGGIGSVPAQVLPHVSGPNAGTTKVPIQQTKLSAYAPPNSSLDTSNLPSVQAGFAVSLSQFHCAGDGVTDDTACLQAAANVGGAIRVPAGAYKLTSTIQLTKAGTVFTGASQGTTYLLKGANVDAVSIQCSYCGLENLSIIGGFTSATATAGVLAQNWAPNVPVPTFTDTTNGVVIGVANVNYPSEWRLRNIAIRNQGNDGVDWEDGPAPILDQVRVDWNGHWGFYSTIGVPMGGTGFDTSHAFESVLLAYFNGSGNFADGGNAFLAGGNNEFSFVKSFFGFGSGIVVASTNSKLHLYSELDAGHSTLPAWAHGTAYVLGSMVLNAGNVYQATNAGSAGTTAPVCTSATCSDGVISWRYRATYGIYLAQTPAYNTNEITILFSQDANGYAMQTGVATSSPIPGIQEVLVGRYMSAPQMSVVDAISNPQNWLNAFQGAGFAGYEAKMMAGGTRRNWFGVHSPWGQSEVFVGTPDNIPLAFYANSNRLGMVTTDGAWRFRNEGSGSSQVQIRASASQNGVDLLQVTDANGNRYASVGGSGGMNVAGNLSWLSSDWSTTYGFVGTSNGTPVEQLANNSVLQWSSAASAAGSADTGFSRCGAGQVCVGNGTANDSSGTVKAAKFVSGLSTPASSSTTCTAGSIWADTGYVYVCTAANTIKRAALTTF